MFREALGDGAWDAFPEQLRQLFAAASPAVLAQIRGQGLDLSEQLLDLRRGNSSIITHLMIASGCWEGLKPYRR